MYLRTSHDIIIKITVAELILLGGNTEKLGRSPPPQFLFLVLSWELTEYSPKASASIFFSRRIFQLHKEEAVKSRNKHLQCGPLCVESYRQILYFLRPFFSGAVYGPFSVANVQKTRFPQIASGGAFSKL